MNDSAMVTQFISNEEHYEKVIERIKNVILILCVVPIFLVSEYFLKSQPYSIRSEKCSKTIFFVPKSVNIYCLLAYNSLMR